ncbi:MAG TPA: VCBS repeat-containing protein [Chitinophagaceae bacterium]|nr:VCBS repeat-containing protein [Chitinophagaceae bacterium]
MRNRIHTLTGLFFIGILICSVTSCGKSDKNDTPVLFEALDAKKTGLNFSNTLTATPEFNMLKYMYFYNGAGVGAGDFNNDGLVDLFFASNQGRNRIFLNTGKLTFKDITEAANIPDDKGWSTGVSVADVNDDGMLDIYVSRVGNYENLHSKNQLLICQKINAEGIPEYKDEAEKYGLDFSGFGTQAAFFDYDLDGDLDLFLLNHSLRYNSTFSPRKAYEHTSDSLSKDCLFRNDGGKFTDVSQEAGVNQSVIGYGLGIVVSDINLDGYPDIYIGNDFHENDYLYINNKKGGFTEDLTRSMMHTSQFSMGVDAADINNDAWPDIIAADMLPSDPYILRRSLGEDEYNTFQIKIRNGYNYQYARNNLQLNNGNGLFSETGLYSNVYATDWSWATLWLDFDNDGKKDLFVSNGIPKRLNDIDYVNYVSNDEIQAKIRANQLAEKDMSLIDKFPQIKLPNRFFRNNGDAAFADVGNMVQNNSDTYSNGALFADFDNDGDLDIVVNNIDEPALLYENKTNDNNDNPAVRLYLHGSAGNRNALGSRVLVFSGSEIRSYEKYPARGFQSSMETPIEIAIGKSKIDSAILIWPDNTYGPIELSRDSLKVEVSYESGLPSFDYSLLKEKNTGQTIHVDNITGATKLLFRHRENSFVEFDREPLLPFMLSQEGPALATGDFNNDGLDDVFVGSSKWEKSALFMQNANGTFFKTQQQELDKDSTYEDVAACFADVNNDSFNDLIIASGGNEFYGNSQYLEPRVYLNDGKGKLVRKTDAIAGILMTASTVSATDVNNDGYVDLFIGGRAVPWEYGKVPESYLLLNDGHGKFSDATTQYAPDLKKIGFIKSSEWVDIDGDKDQDLILSLEWDGICAFINSNGKLSKKYLTDKKGWWNFVRPVDIDNDGDIDFIAGNQGLNCRLKASKDEPVRMYYYDFDANGKKEQVLTYYLEGKELPFANKADLERQMPFLKKKYLYAENFAKATLQDIFGSDLKKADVFSADYLGNCLLINDGNFNFRAVALPWQAQLTEYRDAAIADINKDGYQDIVLAGNFYPNNIQMGRNDADFGTALMNNKNGSFSCESFSGYNLFNEARHVRKLLLGGKREVFLFARNNDSLAVISIK